MLGERVSWSVQQSAESAVRPPGARDHVARVRTRQTRHLGLLPLGAGW